jgi:hypothetical protein
MKIVMRAGIVAIAATLAEASAAGWYGDGETVWPMPVGPVADVVPLPYERANRYDRWQYVAPDRLGRYRPRVAFSPWVPFYLSNGVPFLYTPTRGLEFMPYATD